MNIQEQIALHRYAMKLLYEISICQDQSDKAVKWQQYEAVIDEIVCFTLPEEPIQSSNKDAQDADLWIDDEGNLKFKQEE